MPFVSSSYTANPNAPIRNWVCTRTSALGPYPAHPPTMARHTPNFCGQCVSYVTTVCQNIPVNTGKWGKGVPVKGTAGIAAGTAIGTFDPEGHYHGHAAIYVSQNDVGIQVYDQWITGAGKGVGPRTISWNGTGVSNNGVGFHVIELAP